MSRIAVAVALVVGLLGGFLSASHGSAAFPAADEVLFGCEVIDVEESSSDYVALLLSLDYYGVAGDGREALYSPGCR